MPNFTKLSQHFEMLAAEKTACMEIPSDINFDWYCVVFPFPSFSFPFPFPRSPHLTLAEVCDAAEKGLCWHKSAIWILLLLLLHLGTIYKWHPQNFVLCLHLDSIAVVNSSNLPYYTFFWARPPPHQRGCHLWIVPYYSTPRTHTVRNPPSALGHL